jgi:hypothetical protein
LQRTRDAGHNALRGTTPNGDVARGCVFQTKNADLHLSVPQASGFVITRGLGVGRRLPLFFLRVDGAQNRFGHFEKL